MKPNQIRLVAYVAMGVAGCSHKTDDVGSAQVSVDALSLSSDVKAVEVFVSGAAIPAPMNVPLYVQADGSWKGLVGHIPAGSSNRTFTAIAYDSVAKTNQVYSGSVSGVTINKSQIANVIIVLTETVPNPGFLNRAPVIDSLTVSSTSISFGGSVAYTLTAHDPDPGETAPGPNGLTFTAHVACGTFGTFTDTMVGANRQWASQWTAGTIAASCQLDVTVTDVHGASARASVTITVSASPDTGGARVSTLFESYPVITNVTSTPTAPTLFLLPGGGTTLTVDAIQPDQEPMTFAWSADCAGVFDDASAQSPRFTLAAGSSAPTCTFTVLVSSPTKTGSDGISKRLTTTGSLTVGVGSVTAAPPLGGPVIDYASQSAVEVVHGGELISLYVRARNSNASGTLSGYSWSASAGALGTPVTSPDLAFSVVDWTAPATLAGTMSVTVTVSDSQGGSTSFTFVFCACGGTGPGLAPLTVACGDSACGSDYHSYSCSPAGWVGPDGTCTGNSDGGTAGPGPEGGVCECNGTGPGGVPVTVSCGQSACGSDYILYSCSATGLAGTGQPCGTDGGVACECHGTGPGGVPVVASCGQSACAGNFQVYACTASENWSPTGTSCP